MKGARFRNIVLFCCERSGVHAPMSKSPSFHSPSPSISYPNISSVACRAILARASAVYIELPGKDLQDSDAPVLDEETKSLDYKV